MDTKIDNSLEILEIQETLEAGNIGKIEADAKTARKRFVDFWVRPARAEWEGPQ